MVRIFISYSRKDEVFASQLAADLDGLGADVWIDVDDIPAGMKWSTAIQQGLDACEVMIVVISPDSMASRNAEDEWQSYLDDGKPVIPVLWRPARVHFQLRRIQYVDFHTQEYAPAFAQLHSELRRQGIWLAPLSSTDPSVQIPAQKLLSVQLNRADRRRTYWSMGVVIAVLVIGALILAVSGLLGGGDGGNKGRETPNTQAVSVDGTPTLADTNTPTPTNTPGPSPTSDPLQQAALERAQNFSGISADWGRFAQTFDGVEMVLVPAGCFMMGSTEDEIAALGMGDTFLSEGPQHQVCFEEPFWIDRTEVTNGQFAAFNGQAAVGSNFPGDDRPRNQIAWMEAQAFCESRGARLPTEAEWEYAARGPDDWEYPWGNEFDGNRVVWNRGMEEGTVVVGSLPAGASWVGALDMSGNVLEWVADWYDTGYYGTLADGVVNPTGPTSGEHRVFRGGSWLDNYAGFMRAAYRRDDFPTIQGVGVGFRCARSL